MGSGWRRVRRDFAVGRRPDPEITCERTAWPKRTRTFHPHAEPAVNCRRASSSMAEQRTLNPQVRGSNPRRRTKQFWKFTAGVRVLRGDPFFWIGPPVTLSRTSIGPGPTLGTATRTLRMFGFVLTRRVGSSGQSLRWMNSDIERDGCTFEPKSQDATNDR